MEQLAYMSWGDKKKSASERAASGQFASAFCLSYDYTIMSDKFQDRQTQPEKASSAPWVTGDKSLPM